MKRSPLKRKTPLKRSGQLKRTAIKRTRPKTSPEREKYRRKFPTCQCCHEKPTEHIHEIATRAKSAKAIRLRCCLLALCAACHDRMHDHADYPPARQYALKQREDPEFYDRELLNTLRGRGPNAITQEEVDEWTEFDRVRVVPFRSEIRAVGREPDWPGGRATIPRVNRKAVREMAGGAKDDPDEVKALIRHLELKAESQRRNLDITLKELEQQRRKLQRLSRPA